MEELSNLEKRVLLGVKRIGEVATPAQLMDVAGIEHLVQVMNAASWLQSKGLVNLHDTIEKSIVPRAEAKRWWNSELPEVQIWQWVSAKPNSRASIEDIKKHFREFDERTVGIALGWIRKYGAGLIGSNFLEAVLLPSTVLWQDTRALHVLRDASHKSDKIQIEMLGEEHAEHLKRRGFIDIKETKLRQIRLTTKGKALLERGVALKETVAQITPELLASGKWKEVDIRPYDVQAFAPLPVGGKKHPLRQIIDEIRHVFLDMGFTEIEGAYSRSAFWNMDVLFTPQDHPAREMQDTFYVTQPLDRVPLEADEAIVKKVKAVHEHGGGTGSTGWRNPWSREVAAQRLLRTHTTVDTVRHLYEHRTPPVKIFSVDRVFRNEAVDATHLPEFHQVEGVVMEEGANFRQLLGFLKEFYAKMGFKDIRVRPAYFPYTEPSLELEVFYNGRWMELGGAGMFRPEVLEPLGIEHPVLAWGLGLERLAMMKLGLKDLRELYVSDVEWLRNAPLIE